jgi:amino-acid N-acetyltransferase
MIIVRDATKSDFDEVLKLIHLGAAHGLILKRTKKDIHAQIRDQKVIIALDEEKYIGVAILDFYSKRLSELRSLYILEEYRGKGVGKKLIHSIVEKAKSLKIKELFTITLKEKKSWFEKRGFKQNVHDFKIALFKKL